jgi:predicted TIM-barrel fold metal-dependent hydrolase
MLSRGGNNFPEQLGIELCSAFNNAHRDLWLRSDPRYYAAINVPVEIPSAAVAEIQRLREGELGDRYVTVVIELRTEHPIGNPKYWPIFEACEQFKIPIEFHVSPGRRMTGTGPINFYYEWHVGFPLRNYTVASSLIFEGVFDRFPGLKVALIEQSWAWAVPFSWRLDAAWKMLREEVPDLKRKPSEYLRDHFWFATQPMEEPEHLEDYLKLHDQFETFFGPDHLMFSSDYPHWDFDSPYESIPQSLPLETRRKILGQNASALYGIPLLEGTGISVSE